MIAFLRSMKRLADDPLGESPIVAEVATIMVEALLSTLWCLFSVNYAASTYNSMVMMALQNLVPCSESCRVSRQIRNSVSV